MISRFTNILIVALVLSACGAQQLNPKDYTAIRTSNPRSMVIVPVINHSQEVEAADLFLTTLAIPLAERGYYIFPTNMVKHMMEMDGLADAMLVHSADTRMLAGLFGSDTVLYVEILNWKTSYAVVATGVTVEFLYTLKDGRTGDVLWQEQQVYVHDLSSNSGSFIADLIVNAISAMASNAKADYTPVAIAANSRALFRVGQGLPFGPYSPNYGTDAEAFPSSGTGNISNAKTPAVSARGSAASPGGKPTGSQ